MSTIQTYSIVKSYKKKSKIKNKSRNFWGASELKLSFDTMKKKSHSSLIKMFSLKHYFALFSLVQRMMNQPRRACGCLLGLIYQEKPRVRRSFHGCGPFACEATLALVAPTGASLSAVGPPTDRVWFSGGPPSIRTLRAEKKKQKKTAKMNLLFKTTRPTLHSQSRHGRLPLNLLWKAPAITMRDGELCSM